ncbi:hypothetical protein CR105_04460 [Massilia eurypsychrophila]|uniref:Uncharacterized protein n=1 Tax=Massilia eurypsychrophila TaxID=1485217 RepID=A0A2G8TJV6_9BURK|nr:hypothetical protein [Massilia eurypsychrophila]PIL46335.1 hypothetical protein CR105_04460 [Massilia eurypsychrophila]
MIDRPAKVEFDLSDAQFLLQLAQLESISPRLFDEFSNALEDCAGMPWNDFTDITRPQIFEAAFDGAYVVLRLHFLHGELHVISQLSDDILKLVSITKPLIHV